MTEHGRKSHYGREPSDSWNRGFVEFSDDPLLVIASQIAEWAITFIGPIFWMCLVYLFLVAELAN